MTVAYIDTSCLVAIAFGERGAAPLKRRLRTFDELVAANLLEAELRATFAREGADGAEATLGGVSWVLPDRLLSEEIATVLALGYVRGADCWHLATALYVAGTPGDLTFLTLDAAQKQAAARLGFKT